MSFTAKRRLLYRFRRQNRPVKPHLLALARLCLLFGLLFAFLTVTENCRSLSRGITHRTKPDGSTRRIWKRMPSHRSATHPSIRAPATSEQTGGGGGGVALVVQV